MKFFELTMSNFLEIVKGFYSQRYQKVYNEGKPVDIEVIKTYESFSFHIHGLCIEKAKELQQREFVDEYEYQLRFAFNLENLISGYGGIFLDDLRIFSYMPECMAVDGENYGETVVNKLPNSVWESYKFYQEVEKADWGNAYGLRITIEGQDTLIIHTVTDGADGYLEVFDTQGNNLAAARTFGSAIAWGSISQIRHFLLRGNKYPPELR